MSRDGRELGEITDLELEPDGWALRRLAVRLRRGVLSDLDMHKPLVGTRIVWLPVSMVEGVQDAVVLSTDLADIELGKQPTGHDEAHDPGDPAPPASPAP